MKNLNSYNLKKISLIILILISYTNIFNSESLTSQNKEKIYLNPATLRLKALDNSSLIDKDIGWITTHGEDDNTSYSITVGDAEAFGANFSIINMEINSTILSYFDILVIEEGGSNWLSSELSSLKTWIEHGGALYILGDQPGDSQGNVSEYFNVFYNHSDPQSGPLSNLDLIHPIMEGVASLDSFFPSASINEFASTSFLHIIGRSWDDYPLLASLLVMDGRILWNVDSDGMINDFNIGHEDNRRLANNTWLWLATDNDINNSNNNNGNGIDEDDAFIVLLIIVSSSIGIGAASSILYFRYKKKRSKIL